MEENNFGSKITALRKSKNLTQAYVARELGVTPAAVSKWENGTSKPRVEMLFKLAELLGVNAEELMVQTASEEKQTAEKEPAFPKTLPLLIVVIVLALALVVLGGFLTVDTFNRIKVPNVVGMEISQATEVLEKLGLVVMKVDVYSSDKKNKTVIFQSIQEGERVKPSTSITVTVSKGKKPSVVPNLVEKTLEEARSLLEGTEFEVVIKQEYSSTIKAGTVMRQSLTAGSVFDKKAEIILTVSLGRDFTPVPNLVGKTLDEAEKLLAGTGINIDSNIKCNDTVEEGVIISQDIEAGEMLDRGSWLPVTVSAGKGYDGKDINGGVVEKQGDWIYYRNDRANYCLYKMRPDKSENQLVTTGSVTALCVRDEWIYYSITDQKNAVKGVYKIKLDGSGKTRLAEVESHFVFVKDDWVYYSEIDSAPIYSVLYRVKTDGTQRQLVCKAKIVCAIAIDNKIYCTLYKDQKLYSMDLDGSNMTLVNPDCRVYKMVYNDGYIYYVDGDGNVRRITLDGSSEKILDYEGQVLDLAVVDGYIYVYKSMLSTSSQKGLVITKSRVSSPMVTTELLRMPKTSVVNLYMNVVGDWVYFPNYEDSGLICRVKTDGSGIVEIVGQ